MNEFDDLLDEILHQDANPRPSADLTQKIVARAIDTPHPASDSRKMWAGAAAAIAVAAIVWTLALVKMAPAAPPSAEVSIVQKSEQKQLAPRRPAAPLQTVPLRLRTQRAIRIPPVEVEPLAIPPIVVASIEAGPYEKKGRSE